MSGCSFGELALLKTRGRAATIQCAMPSKFAIVDQKDYLKTVGLEENLKLKKIVSFFRSFRVFEKVKPMDMQRIQKHMKQVKFIRGQKVFTEGSSKTDGLYFIESGDFQVSQSISVDKTKPHEKPAKRALSRKSSNNADPLWDIQSARFLRSHTML